MDFLHLFVLVAFALAQPVYDLLGQNPEFFVSHKASPGLIFGLVVVLSIGVALSLVLLELLMWLIGEPIRRVFHWVVVFGLVALILLPPSKRLLGENDALIMGTALIMSFFFTLFYARWQGMRLFVTMLSPAAVAFPLWFLLVTPVSRLVMPDAIGAQADMEISNPVPVVLVVMDEFSITALLDAEGKIDPVRFPNFSSLAAESWWFPNAVAASESTEQAVPAILTGRKPRSDAKLNPTATDHPRNLFTILGDHYHLNVWEPVTTLCPDALCRHEGDDLRSDRYAAFLSDVLVIFLRIVTPPQIGQELPSLDAQWKGFGLTWFGGDTLTEDVDNSMERPVKESNNRDLHLTYYLSQIKGTRDPGLHFLHVLLPHVTYEYLASGHRYSSERKPFPEGFVEVQEWIGEEPLVLTAYSRYLQQIGYLDRFLGSLRQKLEASHLYDAALIILTADHGVAFQPGLSRRGVQNGNERDILKVPMLVKLPGQHEGRIQEHLVSGIDVLPTIVDVLGVKVPWTMEGRSMVSDDELPRTEIQIPGKGRFTAKALEGFSRLKWQVNHFGMHSSLTHLVPKGPHPALIGRALSDLHLKSSTGLQYRSEDVHHLEYVQTESGYLPALFRAQIFGTDDKNIPIAIALNSRIWATTTTSKWEGRPNFVSVLFPPAAFKDGRNVVGVYRIGETGGELLQIDRDDSDPHVRLHYGLSGLMKLVHSDTHEIIISADRGRMQGNLDSVVLIGNMLVFSGWAGDIEGNQPASEVLIFAGRELVSRVKPASSRQDVADAYKRQGLLHSGFHAFVPVEVLKSQASDIRVVFLSENGRTLGFSISEEQKDVVRAGVGQEFFGQ